MPLRPCQKRCPRVQFGCEFAFAFGSQARRRGSLSERSLEMKENGDEQAESRRLRTCERGQASARADALAGHGESVSAHCVWMEGRGELPGHGGGPGGDGYRWPQCGRTLEAGKYNARARSPGCDTRHGEPHRVTKHAHSPGGASADCCLGAREARPGVMSCPPGERKRASETRAQRRAKPTDGGKRANRHVIGLLGTRHAAAPLRTATGHPRPPPLLARDMSLMSGSASARTRSKGACM
jgi:hypothetical protein